MKWLGYTFKIHPYHSNWADVGGVYAFSHVNNANEWYPLYIGQSKSLMDRVLGHEKWREATDLGATHVLAMCENSKESRLRIERELIHYFNPHLNSV